MIGSLFSGIGGLELGLEWAGLGPVAWQVEQDAYCRKVLAKHWPDAVRYDDVRAVGSHNLSRVEVLCGGFPCQDISVAGLGAGLAGARSGLWREYARIISDLRPRVVVVENVAALRFRGLDVVLGDLAALGYDALWLPIRAADLDAPHLRERLFVVAHAHEVRQSQPQGSIEERGRRALDGSEALVNPHGEQRVDEQQRPALAEAQALPRGRGRSRCKQRAAAQSGVGGAVDGLPDGLDGPWPAWQGEAQGEHEAPRIAPTQPGRIKRLAALGNAVVPQVAYAVGLIAKAMMERANSTAAVAPPMMRAVLEVT